MKGKYSNLRKKPSINPKDDNGKHMSQSDKKSVQFKSNINAGTNHSTAVMDSGNAMHSILKSTLNLAASINSVLTIVKETESHLGAEAELDQTHELSSDYEVIMDILHPDVDYSSDSDSDELTYTDKWLKDPSTIEHIVSSIQPYRGRLATFNVKLFSTETVTALFDTGATCSCISFPLYNQMSDKAQMVEMQL